LSQHLDLSFVVGDVFVNGANHILNP